MSVKNSLIFFMLGNYLRHKEIGNYINESNIDNEIKNDFNEIISISKKIFENIDEKNIKNKKCKEEFKSFDIYYIIVKPDIFYLAAIKKSFEGEEEEIFELFEDIEYQGIKKLTNKNGELSKIGKQNLKFCLEQSNKHDIDNNKSILRFFRMNNDKDQNTNTVSLLSTQLNDIQNNVKDGMKKLLNNVDDMGRIENKSEKIKDSSIDFNSGASILKRRMRCRRISIILCFIIVIIVIILSIIFFR